MNWFAFAILGAMFASLSTILEKKTLRDVHSFDFSVILAVFAAIFTAPVIATAPWDTLTLPVVCGIFGAAIIVCGAYYSVTKGLRHLEVSVASPILLLSPLVTTTLAFLFWESALVMCNSSAWQYSCQDSIFSKPILLRSGVDL